MTNIEGIWENSIFLLKKVLITVITAIGLTATSTRITPPDISNNTIPKETAKQAEQASKEIINNLNNSTSTLNKLTHVVIPEAVDQSRFKIKKLNVLSLIAKDYKIIDESSKKTNNNSQNNTGSNSGSTEKYVDKYKDIISTLSPARTKTESEGKISIKSINTEDSVVNIRCETISSGKIKVITGSGTILSENGTILTAAHVAAPIYAQSLGQNYKCFVKIKNPASGEYPVSVAFIHPNWISQHFNEFDKGYSESGEFDFAILKLNTNPVNNNTKTTGEEQTVNIINSISRSIPSFVDSNMSDSIKIVAYPADSYGKYGVFSVLQRKTENNSVESLLRINSSVEYDYNLIETRTSSIGQSGASGGGVFDISGNLIAVISNIVSIKENSISKNKIRAVSVKYINAEVKKYTGKSILEF